MRWYDYSTFIIISNHFLEIADSDVRHVFFHLQCGMLMQIIICCGSNCSVNKPVKPWQQTVWSLLMAPVMSFRFIDSFSTGQQGGNQCSEKFWSDENCNPSSQAAKSFVGMMIAPITSIGSCVEFSVNPLQTMGCVVFTLSFQPVAIARSFYDPFHAKSTKPWLQHPPPKG